MQIFSVFLLRNLVAEIWRLLFDGSGDQFHDTVLTATAYNYSCGKDPCACLIMTYAWARDHSYSSQLTAQSISLNFNETFMPYDSWSFERSRIRMSTFMYIDLHLLIVKFLQLRSSWYRIEHSTFLFSVYPLLLDYICTLETYHTENSSSLKIISLFIWQQIFHEVQFYSFIQVSSIRVSLNQSLNFLQNYL